MTDDKGILIKNIYYMLAYAFRFLEQSDFDEVDTEAFENIHDMFAEVLGKAVARQLKKGLYREYINQTEDLKVMRGKCNLPGTIRNIVQHKQLLTCEYDELSVNNLFNQIVKTTMLILVKQNSVKPDRKGIMKKELIYFGEVDEIRPSAIPWEQIHFQKNNQSYRFLLNICNLVLQGLLLTREEGSMKLASLLDDQRMSKLYEKFILEYYRYHHPELKPRAMKVSWALDDDKSEFLPEMITDVTLTNGDKTLIIDAKYYANTMQTHFDVKKICSDNMYQLYSYVKNLDKKHTGTVAGMLLYAKTREKIQLDNQYSIDGNQFKVKTLDLNRSFSNIANQLERIARDL